MAHKLKPTEKSVADGRANCSDTVRLFRVDRIASSDVQARQVAQMHSCIVAGSTCKWVYAVVEAAAMKR
jgi:hypothetical protein